MLQRRRVILRHFLPDLREASAGRQADLPCVEPDFPRDRPQERGFAYAVPPDQPDAAPLIDGQVSAVEQGAAGETDDGVRNDKKRHGGGCSTLRP